MFDALTKKMLFSVVELNDNRIDPFSSFETINNRGKDLSTYTRIYHDLRSFEDDDLERFLKHFVAYYYGEKGDFKKVIGNGV